MLCIAEVRDSERLRQFITSGMDRELHEFRCCALLSYFTAGEVVAPTRPDLPRGLNQLGNTCYLNSLLQVGSSVSKNEYWLIMHGSISTRLRTSGKPFYQCRNRT